MSLLRIALNKFFDSSLGYSIVYCSNLCPYNIYTVNHKKCATLFSIITHWRYLLDFLRTSAMLKHVLAIGWTSVRPSVTRWYFFKTAEHIVMLSSPHDSPFILVLCVSRSSRNSDGVTPCRDAKYRWGIKIERFSTNKSLYLANDTIYRHGCYGRPIGTHMRSIKWCHFQ